jgi:hypothetical protein
MTIKKLKKGFFEKTPSELLKKYGKIVVLVKCEGTAQITICFPSKSTA